MKIKTILTRTPCSVKSHEANSFIFEIRQFRLWYASGSKERSYICIWNHSKIEEQSQQINRCCGAINTCFLNFVRKSHQNTINCILALLKICFENRWLGWVLD